MTSRRNADVQQTLLLAALVLAVGGYFLVTRQMRPAPDPGPVAQMTAMGMQAVPEGLDLARARVSDAGLFTVAIAPQEPGFQRNRLHGWVVTLTTPDGAPVAGAALKVDGGMPRHDHGLPTAPEVTRYLGEGRYLVEGLRFHMPGWWELRLEIAAGNTRDSVTFNLVF